MTERPGGSEAGALDVIPRRAWTVLGLTALGQALGTYAGSTLNVAFPSVLASFDVPRSTLGWALSGYSIASASLLLIAGRLSDRISARRVFLTGVLLFAITCLPPQSRQVLSSLSPLAPGKVWRQP